MVFFNYSTMQMTAKVVSAPNPEEVPFEVNLNLIIEFYR